jgi:molybdate/tungstate transport system ATP-binding protein
MLELRSIWKRLGSFQICDLTLRLEEGEYFVILGPSGVGKTILIEIIAGLIPPDHGDILWQGENVTVVPPEERGFGVVYQDYCLFPHMDVLGNIAYGLRARGLGHEEVEKGVMSTAEKLGLSDLLGRYPDTLSGGEQQRVALARSLVTNPRMLLLDEPLSALDPNNRVRLRKKLKRIHSITGSTFLHVTHDTEEAMMLGDRIGVMLDRRIRQVGTPEELFRRPSDREVADFLGMRNVMAVSKIKDSLCHTCGVDIDVADAEETASYIWIKPEEIVLSKGPFESSARNQLRVKVEEWEHSGPLFTVRVSCGALTLNALITYASFKELGISEGVNLYATFKSSAVHCF